MEKIKLNLSFKLSSGEEYKMTIFPGKEEIIREKKFTVSISKEINPMINVGIVETCADKILYLSCSIVLPIRTLRL